MTGSSLATQNQPKNISRVRLLLGLLVVAALLAGELFFASRWFAPVMSPKDSNRLAVFGIAVTILVTVMIAAILILGVLFPVRLRSRLFSTRMIRSILLFCGGIFVSLAAIWVAENYRARRDWEMFKQELASNGQSVGFASVLPPAVPDDQNLAMASVVKGVYATHINDEGKWVNHWNTNIVNRLRMSIHREGNSTVSQLRDDWRVGELIDLKGWQEYYRAPGEALSNEFPVASSPQTPEADVLLALSRYDGPLEELRVETLRRTQCRFPLDYDNEFPPDILLPHLATIKSSLQVLQLRACCYLRQNETQKALEEILLMFRWMNSIRHEPLLISQLVHIAGWGLTVQPIWEGIVEHRWSDAQLVEIEKELQKLDYLKGYQLAMRGEQWMWVATVDYVRRTRLPFRISSEDQIRPDQWQQLFLYGLLPEAFFYRNELQLARLMEECHLTLVDEPRHEISPQGFGYFMRTEARELRRFKPANYYPKKILPQLGSATWRFAHAQAALDLARTACALERYYRLQGSYPEELEAVAPKFIQELPPDVINAHPFRYRRIEGDRYVLYSIGWNGKDDNGTVVMRRGTTPGVELTEGDWVWQFPTSPERH